ncbi:endoglucanase [Pseudoxanthomonas sp. GM95]|uniref:glycoside hydrolase family 5 protein n=1 Tax=Pseudoxanthomonas sp. GM95 TaxID=1881043 RepID=UPI0008BC8DF2|nr:endoglucanase [Pseudoxanthomonas sp. GM95]
MRLSFTASLTALALAFGLACAPAAHAQSKLKYAGVNLAGAEFNSSAKPGVVYKNYVYPTDTDFAYFADQGMNVIRLPFLWERLQPQAGATLDATQLSYIRTAVTRAKNHGLKIILDPHNYAKYNGQFIGSSSVPNAVFADLWRQLATAFANDDAVIFGLMNEPYSISATTWASAAQAGIDAIRATGAKNLVLVPGVAWTGAHSWNSSSAGGGVSNGDALAKLTDPANNLAYEVHQYMDAYYSGTSATCVSPTIGAEKLKGFTDWLRANGKVGFLGEFGAANNDTCMVALDGMLSYMESNRDVWLGWTYWAAGAWWNDSYMFSVQPDKAGNAKPQLAILADHARAITSAAKAVATRTAPPMMSQPALSKPATAAQAPVTAKTAAAVTTSKPVVQVAASVSMPKLVSASKPAAENPLVRAALRRWFATRDASTR